MRMWAVKEQVEGKVSALHLISGFALLSELFRLEVLSGSRQLNRWLVIAPPSGTPAQIDELRRSGIQVRVYSKL